MRRFRLLRRSVSFSIARTRRANRTLLPTAVAFCASFRAALAPPSRLPSSSFPTTTDAVDGADSLSSFRRFNNTSRALVSSSSSSSTKADDDDESFFDASSLDSIPLFDVETKTSMNRCRRSSSSSSSRGGGGESGFFSRGGFATALLLLLLFVGVVSRRSSSIRPRRRCVLTHDDKDEDALSLSLSRCLSFDCFSLQK